MHLDFHLAEASGMQTQMFVYAAYWAVVNKASLIQTTLDCCVSCAHNLFCYNVAKFALDTPPESSAL